MTILVAWLGGEDTRGSSVPQLKDRPLPLKPNRFGDVLLSTLNQFAAPTSN
ncbi:MAG: hypothetical protein ACLPX9_07425 [Rhodomicrobium sp.]